MNWNTTGNLRAYILKLLLVAVVYFVIARLSLRLAYIQPNASPVWPPTGVAFAMLLLLGGRYVWGILLGSFAANLITNLRIPGDPAVWIRVSAAAVIAIGNSVEASIAVSVTRRFACGVEFLKRGSSLIRFAGLAAIPSPLVSAGLGVGALYLAGLTPRETLLDVGVTWYTGNVVGLLVIAPAVMSWRTLPAVRDKELAFWIESILLFMLFAFVGQAICGIFYAERLVGFPKSYMAIPLLVWTSFRFGHRGVTLSILFLGLIAVAGTARGYAVFPAPSPNMSLLYCQFFIGIIATMSLAMASILEELTATNSRLETTVAARTSKLKQLVTEKQDLMTITAHDMQTPLIGLRNLVQLLRRRPNLVNTPEGTDVLHEMERTLVETHQWVERVMEIEKAEELLSRLELNPVDVTAVLDRAISWHTTSAKQLNGIPIDLEVPPGGCLALADAQCLRHVVDNLLSNAIKYSDPDGRVVVAASSHYDRVHVSVTNHGPVIPRQELRYLFEKYNRLRPQRTSGDATHGVGLFVVQRLTAAMKGAVRCQSSAEEGTCFRVELCGVYNGVKEGNENSAYVWAAQE